jgi:hypothetical protein
MKGRSRRPSRVNSSSEMRPPSIVKAARSPVLSDRMRYGRPCQRPMFSTSVREGAWRAPRGGSGRRRARSRRPRGTRSAGSTSSSKRYGEAARLRPARSARPSRPQDDDAAGLVRRLGRACSRVRGARPRITTRARLHLALDVVRIPERGGEVLPAAVGEDRDDDALVELRASLRATWTTAPAETPRRCPRVASRPRTPATLSASRRALPVELRDVEDRRHVAVLERAEAHHRVAGQRLGGRDDDVREALAQPLAGAHQRSAGPSPRRARRRGRAPRRSRRRSRRSGAAGSPVAVLERHEVARLSLASSCASRTAPFEPSAGESTISAP